MTDAERRIADLIRFGQVNEVDYAGARVRVMIGDPDDDENHTITGWLPMAGGRARGDREWHPLEAGERVVVLSESGELQNGIVMPAGIYSSEDPAPGDKAGLWRKSFSDGGVVEYDRESGSFMVDAKTKASLKVGDGLVELTASKLTLKMGDLTLEIGGDGFAFSGGQITHDGHLIDKSHKHTEVQPGGALSGPPE
jgi:phage baseplate assembly protein V